ncbi:MAG: Fe-S cluster assembly protein SufD [Candidatus Omnitrophica bacterium]|nr:Fe-S cluster assembly protein SufD [Candidatus Omnitrophota bacterium]
MKTVFRGTQLYDGFKDSGVDISALADMPWPTFKSEEWKYTNLTGLGEQYFTPVSRFEGALPDRVKDLFMPGAVNFVFVNGLFLEHLSETGKIDPRWQVKTGLDAMGFAKSSVSDLAKNETPVFRALNEAFVKDAIFIGVPQGVKGCAPFHIIHLLDGAVGRQAIFPRTFLKIGRGAGAIFWETVASFDEGEYFHCPVVEGLIEEDASLEYIQAQGHSAQAFHIGSVRIRQERNSRLDSFVLTTGARIFRNNVNVVLEGEGAEARVNGLHALKGDRHADSHTCVDHAAPNTRSDQLYKCILQDKAHSVFNGKIFVRREAQLTNSYQLNKNLILSRECRVDTKPQLEINADDVKCTHGATIGQLNDEELFYLQTRGISKQEARQMLVRGFVDDVLNKIVNPDLRAVIGKMAAF